MHTEAIVYAVAAAPTGQRVLKPDPTIATFALGKLLGDNLIEKYTSDVETWDGQEIPKGLLLYSRTQVSSISSR